jgi:hypothetical protein
MSRRGGGLPEITEINRSLNLVPQFMPIKNHASIRAKKKKKRTKNKDKAHMHN